MTNNVHLNGVRGVSVDERFNFLIEKVAREALVIEKKNGVRSAYIRDIEQQLNNLKAQYNYLKEKDIERGERNRGSSTSN